MVRAALMGDSPTVWYLALPAISGATAATLTWTIGGTWATGGYVVIHLGGKSWNVNIGSSMTPTQAALAIAASINADNDLPCTTPTTPVTPVVVMTIATAGARGSDHIAAVDVSAAPTGFTLTTSGGTAIGNGAYRFAGGASGVDVVAGALAAEFPSRWDYQAWAANDATSVGQIFGQAHLKAGWEIRQYGNICIGSNAATYPVSLSNSMNDAVGQLPWAANGMNHPTEYAARWMAHRAFTETDISVETPFGDPNHNYDDALAFDGFAPFFSEADSPPTPITDAALNSGISPIARNDEGKLRMVRSITTRYISGGVSDFRVLDTGDAVVPQRVTDAVVQLWKEEYKAVNPYVGPDPTNNATLPNGMAAPSTWTPVVVQLLKSAENYNLLRDVDAHPPVIEFNKGLNAIMTQIDIYVTRQHHNAGFLIRQIGSDL